MYVCMLHTTNICTIMWLKSMHGLCNRRDHDRMRQEGGSRGEIKGMLSVNSVCGRYICFVAASSITDRHGSIHLQCFHDMIHAGDRDRYPGGARGVWEGSFTSLESNPAGSSDSFCGRRLDPPGRGRWRREGQVALLYRWGQSCTCDYW